MRSTLGGSTFVAMMYSAHLGKGDDLALFRWLFDAKLRGIFV
jgi:hypothetical protein